MRSRPVDRRILLAGGGSLAFRRLFLIWFGLVGGLPRHKAFSGESQKFNANTGLTSP